MIYVLSGGDSGATLVVTGVAGDTCTITNGTETYTKTFGTDKKATFEGLATGTWTVKMTNGTNTATRTITITADYAMSIAYFSASISVTYPAKSTCVIKNSSGTQVGSSTNTTTTPMTWTTTVDATGTYTITATATDGGQSASQSVEITAEGQVKTVEINFELVLFDGSTGTVASGYSWVVHDILHDDSYGQGYYLPFYGYGGGSGGNISPMIDVSNYSTLKIKACLVGSAMVGTGYGAIGLYKTLPTFTDANPAPVAGIRIGAGQSSQPAGLPAAQEYTVDISALSGEYYFAGISLGWNPAALQVELS